MIVSIHQPNYLPYLGFFHKVSHSDIFISYDTAQFSKNDFQNRNKVKTTHGWTWLTVPVKKPLNMKIAEIEIDNSKNWRKEHLLTLESCYSRSPFSSEYLPYFRQLYSRSWEKLAHLNHEILTHFLELICPDVEFGMASEFNVPNSLSPTAKIISMVEIVGGSTYLSGPYGRRYLDEAEFTKVRLTYQDFKHPIYKQLFGEFLPNLSFADALFNVGEDRLRSMLVESQ